MQHKTPKIAEEFIKLEQQNKKLYDLLLLADKYSRMELGKELVLTHIFRTKAEHEELYKDTPAAKRPASSPHQIWRAADLRSTIYTDAQIKKLLAFFNTFTGIQGKPVAVHHVVAGQQWHFHVSYV
jgi:hypothetical protein